MFCIVSDKKNEKRSMRKANMPRGVTLGGGGGSIFIRRLDRRKRKSPRNNTKEKSSKKKRCRTFNQARHGIVDRSSLSFSSSSTQRNAQSLTTKQQEGLARALVRARI